MLFQQALVWRDAASVALRGVKVLPKLIVLGNLVAKHISHITASAVGRNKTWLEHQIGIPSCSDNKHLQRTG